MTFHPDRHQNPLAKSAAEVQFPKIQQAHSILTDPLKRRAYDYFGMSGVQMLEQDSILTKYEPDEVVQYFYNLIYTLS